MVATLTSTDLENDRCPKCGDHIRDAVLIEGGNALALIERGLEAPMAYRVAKQYTAKCAEIARLRAALKDMGECCVAQEPTRFSCRCYGRHAPAPSAGEEK